MDEIPELGIQASNSYHTDTGLDVAEYYHATAGMKSIEVVYQIYLLAPIVNLFDKHKVPY